MHENRPETAYSGPENDDSALVTAGWLATHRELLGRVWSVSSSLERSTLLLDLVRAQAALHDGQRWHELTGALLGDLLSAGAELASHFVPDDLPKLIDAGDLARVVAFQGGPDQDRLLTAWCRIRTQAIRELAALTAAS